MKQHDFRLAIAAASAWISVLCVQFLESRYLWIIWLIIGLFSTIFLFLWRFTWITLPLIASAVVLASYVAQFPYKESQWTKREFDYSGPLSWITDLHEKLLVKSEALPGYGAQLIPGLTIGNDNNVSETLEKAMQVASLSHLTAISGANCSMVIAIVVSLVAFFGGGRFIQAMTGIVALATYVLIVGPEPSVIRASVMATVVLIAMVSGRPGVGIPILSGAVTLLLIWDPWLANEIGFVLSVVATAGLILFAQPISEKLSRWLPSSLAALIAIPLSAQLVSQPFVALISPYFSTYGLLANMLTAPFAPLSTIFGLFVAVILAMGIPVELIFLWLQWVPSTWIAYSAVTISQLPFAQIHMPGPIAGFIILSLFSATVLMVLLHPSSNVRKLSLFLLVLCISLYGIGALVINSSNKSWIPQDWNIAVCDVGQGDAIILRSEEKYALIDTGKYSERLNDCLSLFGVKHISILVLTHFDKDHVGGRYAAINISETVIVGLPEDKRDEDVIEEFNLAGVEVLPSSQLMKGQLGNAEWKVVWPGTDHPSMAQGNAGSVTLYVNFGNFDALFTGDLDAEAQDALMKEKPLGKIDVVKVSHHGSRDQSPYFYKQISPRVALFSVGKENTYGHPVKETLELFSTQGIPIPRTDHDGHIVVGMRDNDLMVWTER